MNDDRLVTIFKTADLTKAEVICAALEAEEINCMIENEAQAQLFSGVFEARIRVRSVDEVRAREFIAHHEHMHIEGETFDPASEHEPEEV